jgi:hypothetical protein
MTVLEHEGGMVAGVERIDGGLELGGGWAVRLGQGSRGRVALEVYRDDALLDVMVAGALTTELLRGARRGAQGAPALAWGLLPADGRAPLVRFGRGGVNDAAVRTLAGRFWVAFGDPNADRVSVAAHAGAGWEELRVSGAG